MSSEAFLGISTNGWIAIAAFFYAGATLLLAIVTSRASVRAVTASDRHSIEQVTAARDAAKIQATATSISNNRQGWINSLRDEVSGFLADMDHGWELFVTMQPSEAKDEKLGLVDRVIRARLYKIRLLLNPNEGESTALVEMLTATLAQRLIEEEKREQIVTHAQGILKTEWERVKRGE